jgi:hypothetical protein
VTPSPAAEHDTGIIVPVSDRHPFADHVTLAKSRLELQRRAQCQ